MHSGEVGKECAELVGGFLQCRSTIMGRSIMGMSTSMAPSTSVLSASTGLNDTMSFVGTGDFSASSTTLPAVRSVARSAISPTCGVLIFMVSSVKDTSPTLAALFFGQFVESGSKCAEVAEFSRKFFGGRFTTVG